MQSQERSQLVPCWVGRLGSDVSSESSLVGRKALSHFYLCIDQLLELHLSLEDRSDFSARAVSEGRPLKVVIWRSVPFIPEMGRIAFIPERLLSTAPTRWQVLC